MKKLFFIFLLFATVQIVAQPKTRVNQNKNAAMRFSGVNFLGIIYNNTILRAGNHYYSLDGKYFFTFQLDGNLAIYRSADKKVLWSSGTTGRSVRKCEFQTDGNLVLTSSNGTVVWDAFAHQSQQTGSIFENAAENKARGGRTALIMQRDGNLVIYTGKNRSVRWASYSNQ